MTSGTKLNLSPREKYILSDYILKHCAMVEGKEYARWDEESGGTDLTVVERLKSQIPKLTVFHVRYLRQKFDLSMEPARFLFQRKKREEELTALEELRDKVEALTAHIKTCDVRLRDYDARLQILEDKYTAPKR